MKRCLLCNSLFQTENWRCPACSFYPPMISGFPAFAPDFDQGPEGFNPATFSQLAALESDNFWFAARNRLIQWALGRSFPTARSLLEIGCGTGFVLSGVAQAFPDIRLAGSEIHSEGLAFAATRVPGADLMQMDARRIPFVDEFDVVGAFDVLEHIPEDETVLAEVQRALRPNGGVLITVPQHRFLWSQADVAAHHVRRYTAKQLKTKVSQAGFRVLRMTSFVTLLLPLMLASRLARQEAGDAIDEMRISSPINKALGAAMDLERALIRVGLTFPLGGSLLLVARKQNAT